MKKLFYLLLLLPFLFGAMPSNLNDREYQKFSETTAGETSVRVKVSTDSLGVFGWTDDGTIVRLTTITDLVGIGTTSPWEKLTVYDGDFIVSDDSPRVAQRDSDDNVAFSYHLDTADTTWGIYQFWKGTDDGTGFVANPAIPIWYVTAANDIAFPRLITGGGTNGIKITTAGNIGIGTTNPTSLLYVAGNANISGLLTAGTLSGDLSFLNITSGTNASAQMVINTGSALTRSGTGSIDASLLQNATWGAPLAIGTTTPSTGTFTVLTADTSTSTTLFVNTLSGMLKATAGLVGIGTSGTDYYNASVQIDHDALTNTHNLTTDIDHDQLTNYVANKHIDWTNATNNLLTTGNITGSTIAGAFLTVTGNVGIGITNPLGLLVAGTSVGTPSLFVSTGGNVGIGTTAVSKRLNVGGDMDVMGIIYAQSIEQYFVSGNIGAQGNLGIGTTAPIFKLQAIGSGTDRFVFTGGNFGIGITAPTGLLQVGTTPGTPILFVNNANVGIGKTAPSTALEVVGTITADSIASGALLVAGTDVGANLDTAYTHSQDNTQAHSDYLLNSGADETSGILTAAGFITAGTTSSGNLFVTSNVGIGTTNPIYNLQVAGTTASGTLRFGTVYNNILPAGTGANNQILKTNASGVITWQNDEDSGASGVQSVSAALPLTSSGGTAPSIALTIDSGMFDTGVSGELIIKNAGIDLTSKVAGTLPAANIAILPLSTHVSGTLPTASLGVVPLDDTTHISGTLPQAYLSVVPLGTKVSGTLPAASMAIVNLAGGASVVSGTLPSTNVAIIPLSTGVSGTLPDASSPLNIINTTITSNTITGTNLRVITNLGIGYTVPTGLLQVGTTPGAPILFVNNANVGIGTTGPIVKLQVVGSILTTTIKSGDTVPLMRLNILNVTAGSIPGGSLDISKNYVLDQLDAQINGGTNVVFSVFGTSAAGTGPFYELIAGQTATSTRLTVTSFTSNTVPAGHLVVTDLVSVSGTVPGMRLEIHGHEQ